MKLTNLCLAAILLTGSITSASVITYVAPLSGTNENPPTASLGTGFAVVTVDNILQTMEVNVTFSGLTSGNTAAHIHCCVAPGGNAGVATITPTFTGFPGTTTSGAYDHVFDMTNAGSYNPAFVTANGGSLATSESVLFAGIASGQAYLNIHTTNFGGGEIRGFLVQTPEPATLGFVGLALAALLAFGRNRRLSA